MTKPVSLVLHSQLTGYADDQLRKSFASPVAITKPFVLLTGPNGSGKSAVIRGMRSTIGLTGERFGVASKVLGAQTDNGAPTSSLDKALLQRDKPSAVFDLEALGWQGQPCYLFDSRSASQMASKSSFDDDDMLYHISLIAGGGSHVSHGQFVARTWNEALEWACGVPHEARDHRDWNEERREIAKTLTLDDELSSERWLFLDEPENAIDIERLLVGMAVLLQAAEIGTLRVFCSSHSLIFQAGLAEHAKVQIIDLQGTQGASWMKVQKNAMAAAGSPAWLEKVGKDVIAKMTGISTNENTKRPAITQPGASAAYGKKTAKPSASDRRAQAERIYRNLPAGQKSALSKEGRFTTKGLSRQTVEALQRRKIMNLGRLTELGHDIRKIAVVDKKRKTSK